MCTSCGNANHVEAWFEPLTSVTISTASATGAGETAAISSNPMLDGILWGGWRWTNPNSPTVAINYYLAGDNEFGNFDDGWSTIEHTALRNAFDSWERVCNLDFVQVFDPASATFIEHTVPASFWNNPPGFFTLGQHDVPDNPAPAHGFYNWQANGWDWNNPNGGLQIGGIAYLTLVHEIGHGIGLAHPHDTGGGSSIWQGVTGPFNSYGTNNLNQTIYSVMSYNRGWDAILNPEGLGLTAYGYNAGPSAFDIAAAQYLYGANNATQLGNNTYVLPDVNAAGTYWTCIWDCGGTDALVYNGNRSASISLVAATLDNSTTGGGVLSYANSIQGGFTIANGVVIENVTGGFGGDLITGNGADNWIWGRAGDDLIDGQGGIDSAVFSGQRAQYSLTALDGDRVRVTGPDGVDTLAGVERLVFDDIVVDWPLQPENVPTLGDVLWRHDDGTVATVAYELGSASDNWNIDAIGDFDGDGDSDIMWRELGGQVVTWELENGQYYANHSIAMTSTGWEIVDAADFDADGDSDVLWRHRDGAVVTWEMESGTFLQNHNIAYASIGWRIDGMGDFDADGDSDIIWRHQEGAVVTWEMENGEYVVNHNIAFASTGWQIQGTGDFDRDGDDDILWRHRDGAVVAWEMEGGTYFQNRNLANVSTTWQIVGSEDFDSDGDADILWRHDQGQVVTWEMQDGALAQTHDFGVIPIAWQIQGTGEFDLV
jgi:hypothetical protein